jgi:hypothetical protein
MWQHRLICHVKKEANIVRSLAAERDESSLDRRNLGPHCYKLSFKIQY